ncbi:MAG TPA: hypothetical protein VG871_14370 [Vicinamibacterales bacterium]|nr:hypothetical protein [Vicinamibacterales bacterium]
MDLSPTHVHLLLNHIPSIAFIVGVVLFIAGLIARSDHIKQASLVIIAGVALLTIPTYFTGDAARKALETNKDVPLQLMLQHESAAFVALMLMLVTGGFAWLGLWQYRRMLRLPVWNAAVIVLLSVITFGAVTYASSLGGDIRHPEIRVTQVAPDAATAPLPMGRRIGNFVRDTPWLWPTLETLHFVGLSLLMGVLLLVNIRMLGFAKQLSLDAIDRLLPWAILGLGINIVTGMLFTMGADYTKNNAFYWKLAFVVVGGANLLYFFFDRGWAAEPGADVPLTSKVAAFSALFLWFGVMYWGSMLPFIGNAF